MDLKIKSTVPSTKQEVDRWFSFRDDIHKIHLANNSYAEHKILNEFYDNFLGLIDRFVEAYQGDMSKLYTDNNAKDKLLASKSKLLEFIVLFKNHKDLENIIAEMIELHNSTLYKLP